MPKRRLHAHVDGLAERIRDRRELLNWSQGDLANAMGGNASRVEVNHYENGRRMPSAAKLCDIARALRCSSDWLLGLSGSAGGDSRPSRR